MMLMLQLKLWMKSEWTGANHTFTLTQKPSNHTHRQLIRVIEQEFEHPQVMWFDFLCKQKQANMLMSSLIWKVKMLSILHTCFGNCSHYLYFLPLLTTFDQLNATTKTATKRHKPPGCCSRSDPTTPLLTPVTTWQHYTRHYLFRCFSSSQKSSFRAMASLPCTLLAPASPPSLMDALRLRNTHSN